MYEKYKQFKGGIRIESILIDLKFASNLRACLNNEIVIKK